MKTKITSFLWSALLCAMTFATGALADTESGFYEKEHNRGFISIGADYRGMFSEYQKYVNKTAFLNGYHKDPTGDSTKYAGELKYETFDDYYFGMHVNIGAQYKQFLTWFDINFMPTQVSEKPASKNSAEMDLYDVKWFSYGIDWMFGWKLFGENSVINLIPSVGIGFNLLNIHFGSNYTFITEDKEYVDIRNRYYSVFSPTFNSELELRFSFGPFSLGAYGGYRIIRFNEFDVEGYKFGDPDNNGDTWFIGGKVTWTFLSENQKKLRDKL